MTLSIYFPTIKKLYLHFLVKFRLVNHKPLLLTRADCLQQNLGYNEKPVCNEKFCFKLPSGFHSIMK